MSQTPNKKCFIVNADISGTKEDTDEFRDIIKKMCGSQTLNWNSVEGHDIWYCLSKEKDWVTYIKSLIEFNFEPFCNLLEIRKKS